VLGITDEITEVKRGSFWTQISYFWIKDEIDLVKIWLIAQLLKSLNWKNEEKYVELEK
jgi:hypothetical protein